MAEDGLYEYKWQKHLKKQEEQITQLKANQGRQEEVISSYREENLQLRRDLAKFAGHTADCRKGVLIGPDLKLETCTCGYDDKAKEGWE